MVVERKSSRPAASNKLTNTDDDNINDSNDECIPVYEQDVAYVEHYLQELKDEEDGALDSDSTDSLACTCTSLVEMPWHKIAIPEPGSIVIQPTGKVSTYRRCLTVNMSR